jgi:tRNA(fMet)-specific endonuclease VapC
MRRPARLAHRFVQYSGRLAISTIVLGELYVGAFRHSNSTRLFSLIEDLRREVDIIDFDANCALEFGRLRGQSLQVGALTSTVDLMIAAVAIVHDLTLVTNNVKDFRNVPDLHIVDWLTP